MMKNNNLKETLSKLLPIVLLLAGITVLGEGISLLASQAGMRKTDAVIAEITEEPYLINGREKQVVSALVTYTLEDTVYTADLGGVRSGFGTAYLYLPGESPCLSCAGLLETENTPERVNSATVGVIGALCAEITDAVLSGDRSAAGNLYIYDDFEIKKLKIRPERTCSCR